MNNFEDAIENIGQAIELLLLPEDPENNEVRENINALLNYAEEAYILVQWPESQEYMEKEWFEEEAILENSGASQGSAYFIPLKRVLG